jgi:hypothetical protein
MAENAGLLFPDGWPGFGKRMKIFPAMPEFLVSWYLN